MRSLTRSHPARWAAVLTAATTLLALAGAAQASPLTPTSRAAPGRLPAPPP